MSAVSRAPGRGGHGPRPGPASPRGRRTPSLPSSPVLAPLHPRSPSPPARARHRGLGTLSVSPAVAPVSPWAAAGRAGVSGLSAAGYEPRARASRPSRCPRSPFSSSPAASPWLPCSAASGPGLGARARITVRVPGRGCGAAVRKRALAALPAPVSLRRLPRTPSLPRTLPRCDPALRTTHLTPLNFLPLLSHLLSPLPAPRPSLTSLLSRPLPASALLFPAGRSHARWLSTLPYSFFSFSLFPACCVPFLRFPSFCLLCSPPLSRSALAFASGPPASSPLLASPFLSLSFPSPLPPSGLFYPVCLGCSRAAPPPGLPFPTLSHRLSPSFSFPQPRSPRHGLLSSPLSACLAGDRPPPQPVFSLISRFLFPSPHSFFSPYTFSSSFLFAPLSCSSPSLLSPLLFSLPPPSNLSCSFLSLLFESVTSSLLPDFSPPLASFPLHLVSQCQGGPSRLCQPHPLPLPPLLPSPFLKFGADILPGICAAWNRAAKPGLPTPTPPPRVEGPL